MAMYRPLAYTTEVKHPNQRYFLRSILQEDGMFWVLATVWLSDAPVLHVIALLLLLLSFWCIYEQGYVENDRFAAKYEGEAGVVPANFADRPTEEHWAWLWAFGFAAAGIAVLEVGGDVAERNWMSRLPAWLAMLVTARALFHGYNRLAPHSRPLAYPLLQACRSFAILAAVATNVVGLFVLGAHTLARALPYYVYRLMEYPHGRRKQWPSLPTYVIRIFIFVLLMIGLAAGQRGPDVFMSWQVAAILAWCLYRARRQARDAFRQFELLRRD